MSARVENCLHGKEAGMGIALSLSLASVGTACHDRPRPQMSVEVTGLAAVAGRGGRAVHDCSPHDRGLAPHQLDVTHVDR